jgi:hypothetical protein
VQVRHDGSLPRIRHLVQCPRGVLIRWQP